jgi:uncharacterized protein
VRNSFIFAAALFLINTSCLASSFDCSASISHIEKLICDNKDISLLDEKMAEAYTNVIFSEGDGTIHKTQGLWLKTTRNACHSLDCLRKVYQKRIASLEKSLEDIKKRPVGKVKSDAEACDLVANYEARGMIDALHAPTNETERPLDSLKYQIANSKEFSNFPTDSLGNYYSVDLNYDNIPDDIIVFYSGNPALAYRFVRSGKQNSQFHDTHSEDTLSDILNVGGRHYIYFFSDNSPTYLSRLDDDGNIISPCKIERLLSEKPYLVINRNNNVCRKISSKDAKEIEFSSMPSGEISHFDLDNNGTIDTVKRVHDDNYEPWGSPITYLKLLNEDETEISDSDYKSSLENISTVTGPWDTGISAYAIDGTNYIATYSDYDIPELLILKLHLSEAGKLVSDEICKFRYKSGFYAEPYR